MAPCACPSATILAGVDREEIERPGFPVGRRGYDRDAVDAHLRRVADELERLRAAAAAPGGRASLAAGASEQVRGILEAAERSAADLRDDAGRRASAHVARVGEAADGMLRRLDELQGELGALLDGLRQSGERLAEGLAELQERVAGPEPPAGAEPPAGPEPLPADDAGARIIALNMALGGSPRDETAAYLAEHFALPDRDALLDDVYARAASEAVTSAPRVAGRPRAEAQ
jgi:DivIVA domain-containing protein